MHICLLVPVSSRLHGSSAHLFEMNASCSRRHIVIIVRFLVVQTIRDTPKSKLSFLLLKFCDFTGQKGKNMLLKRKDWQTALYKPSRLES